MESDENSEARQKATEQWLAQVTVHYKAKQYDLALAACEKVLSIDPGCAVAYHKKALVLARLGRYQSALIALKKALRLALPNWKLLATRAEIFYAIERYDLALRSYQLALTFNPTQNRLPEKISHARKALDKFLSNYYPGRTMTLYSDEEVFLIAQNIFAHIEKFGDDISQVAASAMLTDALYCIDYQAKIWYFNIDRDEYENDEIDCSELLEEAQNAWDDNEMAPSELFSSEFLDEYGDFGFEEVEIDEL